MNHTRLLTLLLGLLITACAPQRDDGQGGGEDAGPVLDGTPCVDLCTDRAVREENDGFCEVGWSAEGDCEAICASYAGESPGTQEAAAGCISDDPLCFVTWDQCMGMD